jgi:hypothetical protein
MLSDYCWKNVLCLLCIFFLQEVAMIKRLITIGVFLGLFGVVLVFLINAMSPVLPGSSLFWLQDGVEQIGARTGGPTAVFIKQQHLMEVRVDQLNLLYGTQSEESAISALGRAVHRTVLAFSRLGEDDRSSKQDAIITSLKRVNYSLSGSSKSIEERWVKELAREVVALIQNGSYTVGVLQSIIMRPIGDITFVASPTMETGTEVATVEHPALDLTGGHKGIECSVCHAIIENVETPSCVTCHAQKRPAEDHYTTACEMCHTPVGWEQANFSHDTGSQLVCTDCHAKRVPVNHYPLACQTCHTPGSWANPQFGHAPDLAVDCAACHANMAPANHWAQQCSTCHTAGTTWTQAVFNHSSQDVSNCSSCHAGTAPANHYANQCSSCHTPGASWSQVNFDHGVINATNCAGCHQGTAPANHFDMQCSECHKTSGWLPASFDHPFNMNHEGANGNCATCHPAGPPETDCRACHDSKDGGEDDDD